jgi:hypothetical protein
MLLAKEFMMTSLAQENRGQIEHVLESAVVLSWKELLQSSLPGVVQVEYGTAPEPSLQYLKVWLSTARGGWDLVCEYWMAAGTNRTPAIGLTFSNGYYSEQLARMLQDVLRRKDGVPGCLAGDTAVDLIVINSPTEEERRSAGNCMSKTYERLGIKFPGLHGAA